MLGFWSVTGCTTSVTTRAPSSGGTSGATPGSACATNSEKPTAARAFDRDITHSELLRKMNQYRQHERDAVTDPVHLALRAWHDRVEVLPTAPYDEHPLLDRMIDGEPPLHGLRPRGGCHTNVANLPRQYRQYIRLEGKELVSCDISTSQPLLLAILIRNTREEEEGDKRPNPKAVLETSSDTSLTDFLQDCLNGVVYDRIVALTGYVRDDVKGLFLAVIYGHPDHMNTRVGEAIRELYPAVFEAVTEMNYKLGHGGLPRLMQRMEADVMIGRVAARLLREQPSMPLLTVHDCVLVPPEFVSLAEQVIKDEWRGAFGVEPRVKVSAFTSPQQPRRSSLDAASGHRHPCRREPNRHANPSGPLQQPQLDVREFFVRIDEYLN